MMLLFILFLVIIDMFPQRTYADEYFYDKNGRLESVKSINNAVDFYYDLNGNLMRKNPNGNLIRNGDFEISDTSSGTASYWRTYTGPGFQEPKGEIETSTVASGKQSQKIITNGVGGLYQDIQIGGDTSYELIGRIMPSNMLNGTVMLKVDYYNASGNLISGETLAEIGAQNLWTTVGGAIRTPKGTLIARIHFHVASSTGGTLVVDMVSMRKSIYGNMLANGDFEAQQMNGVGDGWGKYGAFGEYQLISSNVTSGVQAQKLTMTNVGGLYQDIAVRGNTLYDINGRINISNLSSGKVQLIVNYFDISGKAISGGILAEVSVIDTWTTTGGIIKTPIGASIARIHIQVASSSGGTLLVDMFTMKKSIDGNMLANGDFEASQIGGVADGWGKYGAYGDYQLTTSTVTSGKQSQRLTMTGTGGIYQDVAVSGNTLYDLNGRINISSLQSGAVKLVVNYFDSSGKAISGLAVTELSTLNVWTTFGGTIKTPTGAVVARIHIHMDSSSGGIFVVDMVNFKKTTDGNMLGNGDFEASQIGGVADGWGKYGAYGDYQLTTSTVTSGTQAQKIGMTGIGGLYQEVAVSAESSYTLSGRINIVNLLSEKVKLIVNYYDSSGRMISGVTLAEVSVLNIWTTVGGTIKPPMGAVSARVHFHMTSSSGGTFVVDKVEFKKS
ncbi:carbohydrate binding domain-containing protein [Paenibacillus sonchi]|uniref:carbohydrate binding domain-containing protein n=1 Tax=Paenibacillus sonchi TaxID=373687 RepID=UPI003145117D